MLDAGHVMEFDPFRQVSAAILENQTRTDLVFGTERVQAVGNGIRTPLPQWLCHLAYFREQNGHIYLNKAREGASPQEGEFSLPSREMAEGAFFTRLEHCQSIDNGAPAMVSSADE